jgi:hypothetical protein
MNQEFPPQTIDATDPGDPLLMVYWKDVDFVPKLCSCCAQLHLYRYREYPGCLSLRASSCLIQSTSSEGKGTCVDPTAAVERALSEVRAPVSRIPPQNGGLVHPHLHASNEGLLRPRVARARGMSQAAYSYLNPSTRDCCAARRAGQ